jgi:hypothetical protein
MKALIILMTLLFTGLSFAGDGHGHGHSHDDGHGHGSHEIKKEETGVIGRTHIERLIRAKKLGESWKKATFDKTVVKKNEWLVTFDNDKGVKGKKLYIFLKKSGEFVAANFTGK